MVLHLIAALGAALCYGVGTILQARGARRVAASAGLDMGLFIRLARSLPYLLGLAIDLIGFVLALIAVRRLPLFVVQAALAASLAVTAVLAQIFLRVRLAAMEWAGVVAACIGLLLLGLSAGAEKPSHVAFMGRMSLVVIAVVLVAVGFLVAAFTAEAGALLLGALAGLGFGLVGFATRVLRHPGSFRGLYADPATYAVLLGGALGLLAFATALQRGSVTRATAATVLCETLIPAVAGIIVLGDRPRAGLWAVAGAGFALTVAGATMLAFFEHEELAVPPPTGRHRRSASEASAATPS